MARTEGIFSLMAKEGLTMLEIQRVRKGGGIRLRGAHEWDDGQRFAGYGAEFNYLDILTDSYRAVGTEDLSASFDKLGLTDYLGRIKQLLTNGGHEGIEFYYYRGRDVRVAFCKHSVAIGLGNRQHALRAGAMRRHEPDEAEIDVLTDGLNLSRAMTYKNATACIPYGGCKTVIQCPPVKLDDLDTIGFISYVADRTRNFPGADMGLDEKMVDIIRERYTRNFIGGTRSPLVSTGTPTAYGEFVAIKEACDLVYGSRDLTGRTVAIQGLGHVGYPLAEYLAGAGARLIVTDTDRGKVADLQQKLGADVVKYVAPEEIYTVAADVFSPCAMGGVITEERIPRFKTGIIIGAANNQLKATSKDEELALARKLADAGIVFVADWAHNTGGVITAALLWQIQDEATWEQLIPKIELPCGTNLRGLIEEARQTGKTPTELAYERVETLVGTGAGTGG